MTFMALLQKLWMCIRSCDGLVLLLAIVTLWGVRKAPKGLCFGNPLSRSQGGALRGLFAGVVVLHHLSSAGGGFLFPRFEYWGALAVSVFFGLSGYGLMVQARNRENYFDSFWGKRLRSLWAPYFVITVLAIVQWIRGDFGIIERLRWKLGVVQNGWFCGVLMMFYVVVWLCHRDNDCSAGEKLALTIGGIFALTWILSACWPASTHVLSNGAFMVGLVAGFYPESTFKLLRKYRKVLLAILLVIVALHLSSELFYRFVEPSRKFLFRFIIGGFWFLCVSAASMTWQLGNRALYWLGSISYELYLVHGWVMDECKHWWPEWTGTGYAWTVLGLSLIMAWALHAALQRFHGREKRQAPWSREDSRELMDWQGVQKGTTHKKSLQSGDSCSCQNDCAGRG